MTPLRKLPDDPCLQIQADLSAMLDGELDASLVRRVMVHSDACPSCSSFLDGIRLQARAHHDMQAIETADITLNSAVPLERYRLELGAEASGLLRLSYPDGRTLADVPLPHDGFELHLPTRDVTMCFWPQRRTTHTVGFDRDNARFGVIHAPDAGGVRRVTFETR